MTSSGRSVHAMRREDLYAPSNVRIDDTESSVVSSANDAQPIAMRFEDKSGSQNDFAPSSSPPSSQQKHQIPLGHLLDGSQFLQVDVMQSMCVDDLLTA